MFWPSSLPKKKFRFWNVDLFCFWCLISVFCIFWPDFDKRFKRYICWQKYLRYPNWSRNSYTLTGYNLRYLLKNFKAQVWKQVHQNTHVLKSCTHFNTSLSKQAHLTLFPGGVYRKWLLRLNVWLSSFKTFWLFLIIKDTNFWQNLTSNFLPYPPGEGGVSDTPPPPGVGRNWHPLGNRVKHNLLLPTNFPELKVYIWRNPICELSICSWYAEKGLASLQSADIVYSFIRFSNICQTPQQAKLQGNISGLYFPLICYREGLKKHCTLKLLAQP